MVRMFLVLVLVKIGLIVVFCGVNGQIVRLGGWKKVGVIRYNGLGI